jgi:hypothetical protein
MFDVFYSGKKPNLFVHEREAQDIDTARTLSRTRYFWWINYLTDYTGFDFLFEPDELEINDRIAWASQWQKDAGTYLVPKSGYHTTVFKKDFVLKRLSDPDRWIIPEKFGVFEIEIENLNWNLLNKRAEISAGIEISRNQNEIDEIN